MFLKYDIKKSIFKESRASTSLLRKPSACASAHALGSHHELGIIYFANIPDSLKLLCLYYI